MTASTPLIHTLKLSIGHGGRSLVRNIDMELPAGSLTALLGINGIGKSTLLRTIAGLQLPLEGEVLVSGESVHSISATERARRIAVVLTGRQDRYVGCGNVGNIGKATVDRSLGAHKKC